MASKILVVDDEPQMESLMLRRFGKKIRAGMYEFAFALSGAAALELLSGDHGFDVVLTDINMPKMDGLTFLSRLRDIDPAPKAVMVSAYGDMTNIRTAMNRGAFDFVTKPINFKDLETTIEKTLKEVEVVKQAELARELAARNEQLQELDQLKSRFFTNISHEFRSPLTIISGMADHMSGWIVSLQAERLKNGVDMIKRNSRSLLGLVNQILSLRKLETGQMQLQLVLADVIPYLRYIMESFQALADHKSIHLQLQTEMESLIMDYDREKLLSIVSNLLTNALKFTPEGGEVYLVVERVELRVERGDLSTAQPSTLNPQLIIKVKDTGIGIPAAKLPHIFDRFYQVDGPANRHGEGTGVGLALTKELIRLMEGEIRVESELGRGTTFYLSIPVKRSAQAPAVTAGKENPSATAFGNMPAAPSMHADPYLSTQDRPNLLIVEDNADVAEYLRNCLEGLYILSFAEDGQEGIDKALEEVPDLIVSDVMMPGKNGYELCQTLKNDQRTSHIPIVLLTAMADDDSRISGLESGADAYLAKPFNQKELLVRLEKLMELRRKLQERYGDPEHPLSPQSAGGGLEDTFLLNVRQTLEKNLDDEYFGLHELYRKIGIGRTQFFKKIKALTGMSAALYIRSLRLHKARQLLKNTHLNITQIAYEVGFRDPNYFTRSFSKEFGETPKEVRTALKE